MEPQKLKTIPTPEEVEGCKTLCRKMKKIFSGKENGLDMEIQHDPDGRYFVSIGGYINAYRNTKTRPKVFMHAFEVRGSNNLVESIDKAYRKAYEEAEERE